MICILPRRNRYYSQTLDQQVLEANAGKKEERALLTRESFGILAINILHLTLKSAEIVLEVAHGLLRVQSHQTVLQRIVAICIHHVL